MLKVPSQPPKIHERHVRMPDGVSRLVRANIVHSRQITGRGVRVAMIDSGFFPHPYYTERRYRIRYVSTPKEPAPHIDHAGHGTAQLAAFFAVAPEAMVFALKATIHDLDDAMEKALTLRPQLICIALELPPDQELPAVDHWVHTAELSGTPVLTGRDMPNLPDAPLLHVPVPPRAKLDRMTAHGWAMYGDEALTASLAAGTGALLLQKCPDLEPSKIREILKLSSDPTLDVDRAVRIACGEDVTIDGTQGARA